MIVFPNAKINLGLNITQKRIDGYHNLETVFYPIPWEDALEVTLPAYADEKYSLEVSGKIPISDISENLVIKAYKMLETDFDLPPVNIWLYKNIPIGAGLGGGSSDAACMLKVLNEICKLNLDTKQLEEYAARLGADCAFFINNRPVFASGIGNVFTPVSLTLKNYQIVVIKPDIFISTRDAFALIKPHIPAHRIIDIINLPVSEWKNHLTNDFELSVFSKYPEIKRLKDLFYQNGAIYASMSGSGSSVYGLFEPGFDIPGFVPDASAHCQAILS